VASMSDTLFYPSLSTLLPLERIPPNLGFVQGALHDVFDNLYFRDLQVSKSKRGEAGFYQLSIVLYKRLAVEIPGAMGAALVLNPGPPAGQTSEIPIALGYRWEILKYLKGFDHSQLNELPRLLFDMLAEIAGADAAALLAELIDRLHGAEVDPFQAFVDAFNLDMLPTVPLTLLVDPDPAIVIEDLLAQLEVQEMAVYELLLSYLDVAASVEDAFAEIAGFFSKWVKAIDIDGFKALLIPHCSVAIRNVALALEFPRSLLKPVDVDTGEVIDANSTLPEDQKQKSRLTFTAGSLLYSTDAGFKFDALGSFAFTPSQIGETGITLGFDNMKLDLSRTTNIPEATADGRPEDFVGVYVQQATIGLPKKWFKSSPTTSAVQIVGSDIILGTGGFSGKIHLDAAGVLHRKLGNFEAALTAFDMRFERNSLIESNIAGTLLIPGFKDAAGNAAEITIKAHIAEDGDFSVTATEPDGIPLKIPGVLDFKVYTLGFGREDDRFFLATSGEVTLAFNIPALSFDRPVAFELKKLLVWEDGKLEIEGGAIILPKALTLKVGPVKISVTAISMGSYERGGHRYKYIGFDGGVNVNPGGVDVRASGVKVYWRTDGPPLDVFMRVEGVAIDIVIPGGKSADEATVLISGFLQVKEADPAIPGSGTEYAGGVSVKLPKAGIGGSAAMRLNPSAPAFIIDTELSISVPIPLGNTSLGIYGFRGMLGLRYVADRAYPPLALAADATWYEYYKKKVPLLYKEGVDIHKFAPRKGFAIGAGLTIGTLTDSGRAVSAKLFLLLSLPDALLLQGQAAIMAERVDLSPDDPPFSALLAVTRQSVEAAFGVNYKLPDTGAILDLQALIEMGFYFNDASAWYINVGRDQPESKRVTARLFTLFNAWSYLMLSGSGIKAGAGVTWDFQKNFGPVGISAHAYLVTEGRISFKPKQIGAAIMLGGSASIKVCKFKMGLSIAAALAAEAPEPFIVTGSVDVTLDLPKPIKKLGGTFTLDFTWTFNSTLNETPVALFNEADVGEAAKALALATRERFALNVPAGGAGASALPPPPSSGWQGSFDQFVVPLDAQIDIEFKKPIAPAATVTNIGIAGAGFDNTELVPPQRGKSAQVRHEYVVEEVTIRAWNPASLQWEDFDVYEALTPLQHAAFVDPADLAGLKQGWWQMDQPGKVNKLSLLAQTPLSYANDVAGPFVPENSGITTQTVFCPATPIAEQCLRVDDFEGIDVLTAGRRYAVQSVQGRVTGADGHVARFPNPFGLARGVALAPASRLEIFFPQAAAKVTLRLATLADNVTLLYQRRRQIGVDSSAQPLFDYLTVKQQLVDAVNLLEPVRYDAAGAPIDKVVIVAGPCDCKDGLTAAAAPPSAPSAAAAMIIPGAAGPPACGSVDAYFANTCGDIRRQLDALIRSYEKLVAQAATYATLADKFQDDDCDPSLTIRYRQLEQELLSEAQAMRDEIARLSELVRWCAKDPAGNPREREGFDPAFDYRCKTFYFAVCWLPLQDEIYNSTIPSFSTLMANNAAMTTAINNTIRPILRPDTTYAVSIQTIDKVSVAEKGHSSATPVYMHVGFRTAGPIGHFHQHRAEYAALALQDRADEFRLQSLKPYIDYSKSYPNADGNILSAKPLFYVAPKLNLCFLHPWIYTMYGGQFDAYHGNAAVSSRLEASILDPLDPLPAAAGDPGHVGPATVTFAANGVGQSAFDLQLLNNMATQGQPCTASVGIVPMGIQSEVTVDRLKPLKLYLAVFKAVYNGVAIEAHRYNFQTSRYADFPEQVNSYRLRDRDGSHLRNALFDDIGVTLDAGRTAGLAALIAGSFPAGDPLEQDYADPFDRLIDGILRIGPLDPPVGTDFSLVRDAATGKVIGVLVRNPEPFNDPKIPAADIAATILLSQQNAPAKVFKTFHAKDRSRAFVADPAMDLALHDLEFTFTYLVFDGAAYVPASIVSVQPLVAP
jgi:hypothetical protein